MKRKKVLSRGWGLWGSALFTTLLGACSPHNYIPDGEQLYTGVAKIEVDGKQGGEHFRKALDEAKSTLNVPPNGSIFGDPKLRLPFTYGFYFNKKYENTRSKIGRWLYRAFGEKPKLISTVNPSGRSVIASQVLQEFGFFGANVTSEVIPHRNDSLQAKVKYHIYLGTPYTYDSIEYRIPIITPDSIDLSAPEDRLIHKGDYFNVHNLESERARITSLLRERGYYYFRTNNLIYKADTLMTPGQIQMRVELTDKTPPEAKRAWKVGRVSVNLYDGVNSPLTDSLQYKDVLFRFHKKIPVRPQFLYPKIHIKTDSLFSGSSQQRTSSQLATLNTFVYSNVIYTPADSLSDVLNATIVAKEDLPYYAELETNLRSKSNSMMGSGIGFTLNRKNLFRGGEILSLTAGVNYERQTYRRTSDTRWDINSYEFMLSTGLTFPRVLVPKLAYKNFRYPASTRILLSGGLLNRARFYQLGQFSGSLTYQFEPRFGITHTITPLRLTYNHLLRRTEQFDAVMLENPAVSLAFQNQFVPSVSYHFTYDYINPESFHGFSIDAYIAEAGNIFSLFYSGKKGDGPHKFLGAPFAQFVKGSLEFRYSYRINALSQIASRLFAGAVYSYGNTTVAPYKEQFYSGGVNSIRGFNVRTIGPGSYSPTSWNQYSFLDRTGDIRLEANIEYRRKVVGQLELATFLDAGNVWLFREDPYRPGGKISSKRFLKDLALGSGVGLRYDLNYLVVRLDLGVALHSPCKSQERYFNTFNSKDWYAIHLAIGYPF